MGVACPNLGWKPRPLIKICLRGSLIVINRITSTCAGENQQNQHVQVRFAKYAAYMRKLHQLTAESSHGRAELLPSLYEYPTVLIDVALVNEAVCVSGM